MAIFRKNIAPKGRQIRAAAALAMATGSFFVWPHSRVAGIALAASSVFLAFEAARGWCALRACGLKTKF